MTKDKMEITSFLKSLSSFNPLSTDRTLIDRNYFVKDILFNIFREKHKSERLPGVFPSFPHQFSNLNPIFDDQKEIQNAKVVINAMKKYLSKTKQLQFSFADGEDLLFAHFIETFHALERSIFWFFNYKFNMNPFHDIAANQALYYSEFFGINAVLRLFGGSISHLTFGNFKIETDWSNQQVNIQFQLKTMGDHQEIIRFFGTTLQNFNLTAFHEFEANFSNIMRSFLSEERVSYVYDMTDPSSDPFKNYYMAELDGFGEYQRQIQFCFLDETPPIHSDDEDGSATEYLAGLHADWGYKEYYVGLLLKFIIQNLKELENCSEYFVLIKEKIERFLREGYVDENAARIVLKWI